MFCAKRGVPAKPGFREKRVDSFSSWVDVGRFGRFGLIFQFRSPGLVLKSFDHSRQVFPLALRVSLAVPWLTGSPPVAHLFEEYFVPSAVFRRSQGFEKSGSKILWHDGFSSNFGILVANVRFGRLRRSQIHKIGYCRTSVGSHDS